MVATPDRLVAARAVFADLWATYGGLDHDELAAQLEATAEEYAFLAARYGPGGTYDAERKARRSLYEIQIREEYAAKQERLTDGKAETLAAAHPEVTKALDVAYFDRVRYVALGEKREAIKARMAHLSAVARAGGRAPGY